jgi:hypothetical protein
MLRYANWSRLATWSGKRDYRPEERGGTPVGKGARFRMTDASVGGLSHLESRTGPPPFVSTLLLRSRPDDPDDHRQAHQRAE